MITPQMIARINELARRQREATLSEAELAEQAQLRQLYIQAIKTKVKAQLDAGPSPHRHDCGCSCGCHKHH
ncbi:MAG: DUF896 domain-containing protein [Sporomusaceae bacterium]|nr:DUF896 domain-containing protein [Sporomusaceae bacterium]